MELEGVKILDGLEAVLRALVAATATRQCAHRNRVAVQLGATVQSGTQGVAR